MSIIEFRRQSDDFEKKNKNKKLTAKDTMKAFSANNSVHSYSSATCAVYKARYLLFEMYVSSEGLDQCVHSLVTDPLSLIDTGRCKKACMQNVHVLHQLQNSA